MPSNGSYLFELFSTGLVSCTHLNDESHTREKNAVVAVLEEGLGFIGEMVNQIWHASDDSQCAQGGLYGNIRREGVRSLS